MAVFRFLHAADLHLDSPLIGLAQKSRELASQIDHASRRAFDNLVSLAIEEGCRFVLLSGDLFDGQWRDYRTGLFFADRLRQLEEAGVDVYVILGNHDAESRFASRLELSRNVHLFSPRKAETVRVEGLDAAIHGRSFPHREVTENIALNYPPPEPDCFNVGLLHTACSGRDGHASYAPCSLDQLVNHGYDYWALGHVHAREVLSEYPHVVYSGNLQGRNSRETGPKGASLVMVQDGRVAGCEHRVLDAVRWSTATVPVGSSDDTTTVLESTRKHVEHELDAADGRPLVLRLRFTGVTSLHNELVASSTQLREELETMAATISDEAWIEKFEVATQPPPRPATNYPTIASRVKSLVDELGGDLAILELLDAKLKEVREKLPAAARSDELWSGIRSEEPARALRLALSLIEGQGE